MYNIITKLTVSSLSSRHKTINVVINKEINKTFFISTAFSFSEITWKLYRAIFRVIILSKLVYVTNIISFAVLVSSSNH